MSKKGEKLLSYYSEMLGGYRKTDSTVETNVYSDMEIRKFRAPVKSVLQYYNCKSLLDYGCGGSSYTDIPFEHGKNGMDYFNLNEVFYYEPARKIDMRQKADAVVCFDVLEHIWLNDIASTIREICSYAEKVVILNIACYSARALLPNGENAHITNRNPIYWRGLIDGILMEHFPNLPLQLYCSTAHGTASDMGLYSMSEFDDLDTFVADPSLIKPKISSK